MRQRKSAKNLIAILRDHKQELRDGYHVRAIGIFGSYARNDAGSASDVDILVELDQPVGWEIVDLQKYLEHLIGMKVDLLTKGALAKRPLLWQSIAENLIYA